MARRVINKPRESREALVYRGVICNFLSSHSKSNDRTGNSCHLPKVCKACVSKAPKQHILYECKKFMHSLVSDWVLSTSQTHRVTSGRTNNAFSEQMCTTASHVPWLTMKTRKSRLINDSNKLTWAQDGIKTMCLGKSKHMFHPVCQMFLRCCLWNCSSDSVGLI